MRVLPLVLLLAMAGLVAAPTAAAATFDLGASKIIERPLQPGEDAVFEMPLRVNQDGFLYAKVLPTPASAVNNGARANGSTVDDSGWRVSFAMILPSGERVEMGKYVDSTVSKLVAVKTGDAPTFVATVHVPADAARGGPQQKAYVAIAYRLSDGTSAGANSGGVIDEARALTLLLSNALLPPAEQFQPPSGEGAATPTPTTDGTTPTPTTDGATPAPTTGEGAAGGTTGTPGAGAEESTEVPPVAPITGGVIVQPFSLPTWFLVAVLVLAAGLLLAVGFLAGALREIARLRASLAAAVPRDPKRADPPEAREVPVERGPSRVEVRRAREE